jgi:hypothetical protein
MLIQPKPKKQSITSKAVSKNFESVISRDYIGKELKERLKNANVLMVPNEGYQDKQDLLYFPSGTSDLYHYLLEKQGDSFKVDINLEDKDYKELALHADWMILAEFIVKEIVAPLLVALVAEYIIRHLGKRKHSTNVKSKLTVVDEKKGKQIEYTYEGPASEYRNVMLNAISKFNEDGLRLPAEIKPKRKHRPKKK